MAVIKQISVICKEIAKKEKELAKLKEDQSKQLAKLIVEKGKNFNQGGKHFQIRQRGNKYFLVSSKVPFGSWLKKENRVTV